MNEIAQLLVSRWYIVTPIIIIVIVMIFILIRRGYIKQIDLFGIKIDFQSHDNQNSREKTVPKPNIKNSKQENQGSIVQGTINKYNKSVDNEEVSGIPVYSADSQEFTINDLHYYRRVFTSDAIKDLQKLEMTQDQVIDLVQIEFLSHLPYFRYDILDYPLPVQRQYLVVLDKVGRSVTIRAIKKAEWTELELASWSSILGLYRRCTRLQYRTDRDYILRPEVIRRITADHNYILKHILRHLAQYKNVDIGNGGDIGGGIASYMGGLTRVLAHVSNKESIKVLSEQDMLSLVKAFEYPFPEEYKYIPYHIASSSLALLSIDEVVSDVENKITSEDAGQAEIVLALEKSLQYIHKIILSIM